MKDVYTFGEQEQMAQAPFTIKANYPYTARSDNEASLNPNQTYTVLQTDGGANVWWNIKDHTGKVGWIPANYATIVPAEAPASVQTPPQATPQPVAKTQPAANPFKAQPTPQPAAQPVAQTQPVAEHKPAGQPAHGTALKGGAVSSQVRCFLVLVTKSL